MPEAVMSGTLAPESGTLSMDGPWDGYWSDLLRRAAEWPAGSSGAKEEESVMVRLEALIPASALTAMKEALDDLGVSGLTVTDQNGAGAANSGSFRGRRFTLPRALLRVEVAMPARRQEEALDVVSRALQESGATDSLLVVTPLTAVIRIRTGERNEDAVLE